MILEALLIAAGSAVIAGATMTVKDKDRIIQPTTINNNINNSINNSFNKRVVTTKTSTASNVKKNHTTQQQSAKIDHDKIIDELYARYKLERNEEELNELLEKLNNLK